MIGLPLRRRLSRALTAITCSTLIVGSAQAAVAVYKTGDANDPRVRAAKFLGEDKRHLSALTELLKMQDESGEPGKVQYPWLLAENYLSFGLRDRADSVYQKLGRANGEPLEYDRGLLRMAQFEYTRGYYAEARNQLVKMRDGLPKALVLEWQDLYARVLMSEGRVAEAIEILRGEKNGSDQTEYTRYNLGVALLSERSTEQGRTVMDRVGRLKPKDGDELALMDRANLTLGWHFLQEGQGASAKPILRRVRIEGPYSNRALLGLGWAELTTDGARASRSPGEEGESERDPLVSFSTLGVLLRRGLVDDPAPKRNFRRATASAETEGAVKNALGPWLALIDRDPQDPAVQEGWLAIPYALDQIGAHEEARTYYEQAITRLEAARVRSNAAVEAIKSSRMVETIVKRDLDAESGWNWELKDLPDAPETYYLQTLIAEHRFAEALKNYRDTRLLVRSLETWDYRLAQMEKSYATTERVSVDPQELFARAMSVGKPPARLAAKIELPLATALSEPGRYTDKAPDFPKASASLRLAGAPKTFNGSYERLGNLRRRLGSLRPALITTGDQQGKVLQAMATTELQAQKNRIEKYLVEARFALARLYDRQLGPNDPDEYEIKK